MCIYCGTTKYRKIYEQHYGLIPREENGRAYEVHHKDGNHKNNDPSNLVAVTIQEHYDLHYSRGEYQACRLIAVQRMHKTPEEISEISRLAALEQLKNGTHISQKDGGMNNAWEATRKQVKDGTHKFLDSEFHKINNAKRIANGTHHFLNPEFQKEVARKALENGNHKFSDADWQKEKTKNKYRTVRTAFWVGRYKEIESEMVLTHHNCNGHVSIAALQVKEKETSLDITVIIAPNHKFLFYRSILPTNLDEPRLSARRQLHEPF